MQIISFWCIPFQAALYGYRLKGNIMIFILKMLLLKFSYNKIDLLPFGVQLYVLTNVWIHGATTTNRLQKSSIAPKSPLYYPSGIPFFLYS